MQAGAGSTRVLSETINIIYLYSEPNLAPTCNCILQAYGLDTHAPARLGMSA